MIVKDLPLIGFTILCQLSVGALILYNFIVFLPTFNNKTKLPAHFKTTPVLILIFLVLAVIVSLLHLGKPLNAFQTLENLSTSWLSREIFMLMVYFLFTGLFTFFLFVMSEWKRLILTILNLATLSGIILIFVMSRIYSSLPIPLWQPTFTFLNFLAATLSLGGILLLLTQIRTGSLSAQKSLTWILGIVMLLEILFIPIFLSYLDQNSPASQLSLKLLLQDYTLLFYFRLGFQIISLGLIFLAIFHIRSDTNECRKLVWPVLWATASILISEILGRIMFYAAEVPIGSL